MPTLTFKPASKPCCEKFSPSLQTKNSHVWSLSFQYIYLPLSCPVAHRICTAQPSCPSRLQVEPRGLRCLDCPPRAAEPCLSSRCWHSNYMGNAKTSTLRIRRGEISGAAELKEEEKSSEPWLSMTTSLWITLPSIKKKKRKNKIKKKNPAILLTCLLYSEFCDFPSSP